MIDLRCGDCLEVLRAMPADSVHCVVTSPPYWGLRDYGVPGQIGLEPTPDAFVTRMVEVFAEVRRVLRDDGTLWLNLGDSYAGNGPLSQKQTDADIRHATVGNALAKCQRRIGTVGGLKPKDLVGIPWRVAFALQADGWYLRSDIIWHKPNPMPESVRDRPTKSHEYLFLLSKAERYYFDADAVREPQSPPTGGRQRAALRGSFDYAGATHKTQESVGKGARNSGVYSSPINPAGRNIRTVWTIATRAYKGAHFATFPPKLVTPCIRAGTSERGVCPACGAGWERMVERASYERDHTDPKKLAKVDFFNGKGSGGNEGMIKSGKAWSEFKAANPDRHLGWRPTCACDAGDPVPATVLDPFAGSGTTGAVAKSLGRSFVGIDLNPEYLKLAEARIGAATEAACG